MGIHRSYLACYDVADAKRLRKVSRLMEGYGYRIQKSVFFCQLSDVMKATLMGEVEKILNKVDDQCLLVDLGLHADLTEVAKVIGKKITPIPQIILV